ncbi:MAG: NlpC/P60 family protein [Ilumatobacteraceae bacterium]
MTFTHTVRRTVVAAALAAATVSTVAVPLTAHAAPIAVQAPVRGSDPLAEAAAQALSTLNRSLESGDSATIVSSAQQLDALAQAVAERLGIDVATLQAAWRNADTDHQRALLGALTQLGVPYRKNTSKPGIGFDCSGITTYAWAQAGFTLTRQSTSQIRSAAPRTAATAQAGDLVQYPGHVMMWLGVDRAVVHAIGRGRSVEIDITKSRRSLRFGDPTGN